ncbi:phosphatase PAP2 family protein [Haloarchaeobius amylolyticus]|uniref:phosphatase PAP2 family protein n=1 Tax=Haloarchaeobius amylolyticus TaxID=1198296 RepID=UPI00226E5E7D|nr:phosphatase PAP2 family protein [Haloarchaeobius amylolyticus]
MEQLLPSLTHGTLFSLLVAVPTLLVFALGFRLFVPGVSLRSFAGGLVRTDWKYLGVAWTVTFGVNTLAHNFYAGRTYTSVIYGLEGTTVMLFQAVTWVPLTYAMTFVYLIGFPFVTLFTYWKLKAHDPEQARRYCAGYALLVLMALPYFLAFPVAVTSEYLGHTASGGTGMEALMYDLHPIITEGITSTDTLVKAFPSLHTGISALAAVYARYSTKHYARLATGLTVAIVFSTFYLGVHWLTDAAFALVLVGLSFYISQRIADPATYEERLKKALRDQSSSDGGYGRSAD